MSLAQYYDMPYGTIKARTGDPYEFLHNKLTAEIEKVN
jgi:hypothetical protein